MKKVGLSARSRTIPVLVLAALVGASLGVSLFGGFVWDDGPLIVDNRRVQDPGEVGRILTESFWETGDQHDRFRSFFRPLVSLSFAADYAIWGLRPWGYHLTNLLLHFLCCWLVYRIGESESLPPQAALAGAALFAVHPIHVESVAWISGRTDLLCGLFFLASFLAFRRAAGGVAGRRWLSVSLLLFALALFSKEMAATLPLLIFGDRWIAGRGREGRWRQACSTAWPYLAVLLLYLVARRLVLGESGLPVYELTPLGYLASAAFVLARYVTLLILPVALDAHYPYAPLDGLTDPKFLFAAAMLLVIGAAMIWIYRRSPRVAFWLAWIFVGLAPVLSLGRFGDVLLADRFLYLPSVGLALLAARGTAWISGGAVPHGWRRPLAVAGLVLLLLLGVLSWNRSRVWRDDLTLFTDMLRTSPASALVRYNLGLTRYARGEYEEAIQEFRLATTLSESYSLAHNNLAAALERQGALEEALAEYRRALRIAPGLMEASANAGSLLVRLGRPGEGLELLRGAVLEFPDSAAALYAMAAALDLLGRGDEALSYLERARRADPGHAPTWYLLGKLLHEQGREADAARSMRRFLALWDEGEGAHTAAARRVIAQVEGRDAERPSDR